MRLEDKVDLIRDHYGDELDVLQVSQRIGEEPKIAVRLSPNVHDILVNITVDGVE